MTAKSMGKQVEDDEDLLLRLLLELAHESPAAPNSDVLVPPGALWQCLQRDASSDSDEEPSRRKSGVNSFMVDDDSFSSRLSGRWRTGLCQMVDLSNAMTAFDLHSSATQALILAVDNDKTSSHRGDSTVFFTTVCLLLCCLALQKRVTNTADCSSSNKQRPKRWQSLVFETVRLFQTHVLGRNTDHMERLHKVWIPLWVDQVVPSTYSVQQILLSSSASSDVSPVDSSNLLFSLRAEDSAYLSGIVATSTVLARKCGICIQVPTLLDESVFTDTLLQRLLLNEPVEGRSDLVLWYHPWRKHYGTFTKQENGRFRSLQAALYFWTSSSSSTEDDEIMEADKRESVLFLETRWDDLGLATLAAFAWEQRSIVWSHGYVWKLWFPQVSVLLNADERGDEDMKQSTCTVFQLIGYRLLDSLLRCVPSAALTLQCQRRTSSSRSPPDDPIGTFQLMSNRIVASAAEAGRFGAGRGSSRPQASGLLDGAASFQMMQRLIGKYRPTDQILIVRNLVQDCPHPGLRPKLLDLLRSFVHWDTSVVAGVWQYCDEILRDLEGHELSVKGKEPQLRSVDELVKTTELYNSCLSMLYLWILVNKNIPALPGFATRVAKFHALLQSTLQRTSMAVLSSEQYYRLHILESTLQQIIDCVEEVGKQFES